MSVTAAYASARLQEIAKATDDLIEKAIGERCGFVLLVFAGGEVNYVSSDADRVRTAKAMREIIAKWEAGVAAIPAHERN